MRFLTIISIFLFASNLIHAQDTLYKVNQEKIVVKVQQVGPTEITYKRSDSPDGPLYVILSSDVLKIVYANGHIDMFAGNTDYSAIGIDFPYHKWTAAVNAFDLMFGIVSVSGAYTTKNNLLTVRIPISCGVAAISGKEPGPYYEYPDYFYYNKNKIFSTGIDLRFSPAKKVRRANYYLGASFEFGMINYKTYYYLDFPPYSSDPEKTKIASYAATGVTNGVLIKASDNITVGIDFTGGMMVTHVGERTDYKPMARFGLNMGYSFGK